MRYSIKELSLEEKLRLLTGKDSWHIEDLKGKLYAVSVTDGPVGVRKVVVGEDGKEKTLPAVAYPACNVLAQTWDLSLAYRMGECLADDCIDAEKDILLAPGVNIKRSPLCGRNFEYMSEDPLVAGVMAREYIAGVQSKHVGTCLKHYCANNSEFARIWTSSEVDERTLREIYLEPFRIACEANPTTVMCGYNLVNGQRMSEHKALYTVLRNEFWREDGLIFSDWGAVKDPAASVRAGLDVEMPYAARSFERLKEAYERGELTEAEIDECVQRILLLADDMQTEREKRKASSTREARREVSQAIAEAGVVLLKNNGVLPLQDGAEILLTGENPDAYYSGGGSSRVVLESGARTLDDALVQALPHVKIQKAKKSHWSETYYEAFEGGYGKDATIVVCGSEESEESDRRSMKLPWEDEMLILQSAERNANTIVVLRYGSAVDTSAWLDKVAAVVWAGYGGERGNEALAGVLAGKVNPSGKLTETFARSYEDYPVAHTKRTHAINVYSEGLSVGYRYFDEKPEAVVFPFGYGLSYSTFQYADLQVEEREGGFAVRFTVENTSEHAGAEVAQVYVRQINSRVTRPYKELKGFEKVRVGANEKGTVEIFLEKRAFAYYSTARGGWFTEAGEYEILVGKNAREICLKKTVKII